VKYTERLYERAWEVFLKMRKSEWTSKEAVKSVVDEVLRIERARIEHNIPLSHGGK